MEVFTFVQMGGLREHMPVRPLDEDCEHTYRMLEEFDAKGARCFLSADREKLISIIEASFGTFQPFNKIVRAIFMQQLATTSRLTSASEAMPVVTVEMISPSISLQPTTMRPCVRVV